MKWYKILHTVLVIFWIWDTVLIDTVMPVNPFQMGILHLSFLVKPDGWWENPWSWEPIVHHVNLFPRPEYETKQLFGFIQNNGQKLFSLNLNNRKYHMKELKSEP